MVMQHYANGGRERRKNGRRKGGREEGREGEEG